MSPISRTVTCFLLASGVLLSPTYAQEGGKPVVPGNQRYYYNPLEQSLQWLRSEQIQKEIELVPDQQKKLDKIRQDYYAKTQQMYKDLRNVDGSKRYEKLYEMRKQLSRDVETRVRKVLLKQQVDRLQQIMLQMALQRQGSSRTLFSNEIAQTLNLTEDQKVKLQEAENQARREMQEKLRKHQEELRAKMVEQILGELDDKQRAKLKKMMGEDFELKPQSIRPAGSKAGK